MVSTPETVPDAVPEYIPEELDAYAQEQVERDRVAQELRTAAQQLRAGLPSLDEPAPPLLIVDESRNPEEEVTADAA